MGALCAVVCPEHIQAAVVHSSGPADDDVHVVVHQHTSTGAVESLATAAAEQTCQDLVTRTGGGQTFLSDACMLNYIDWFRIVGSAS